MKRLFLIVLCLLLVAGCSFKYSLDTTDPQTRAKQVYLESSTMYNSTLTAAIASIRSIQDPVERKKLWSEMDKYVQDANKALNAWKLAIDVWDEGQAQVSEEEYQKAKQLLLNFIFSKLSNR